MSRTGRSTRAVARVGPWPSESMTECRRRFPKIRGTTVPSTRRSSRTACPRSRSHGTCDRRPRALSVGVVTCHLGPVTLRSNLEARGIGPVRNVASDDAWRKVPFPPHESKCLDGPPPAKPTSWACARPLVCAREKGVVPVVDGDINETWSLRFQGFPQDGIQLGRMTDAEAPDSERLR